MSARLVIHAEIETHEDFAEVVGVYLKKESGNPFTFMRAREFLIGVAHGLVAQEEPAPAEQEATAEGVTP